MTQRAKGEQSSMDIVGKYCIVRSANAGVFAGCLKLNPQRNFAQTVTRLV